MDREPKFENNPQPEAEKDPWELQELEQLKGEDRSAALIWEDENAKKFAEENNLDLIELPPPIEEKPNRYIIAKKEKTANILEEKVNVLSSGKISEKVKALYSKIKEMSAAEATKFLIEQPFGDDGKESPEVAVIEGLMFGYKPCDVEYYVNTRYFGEEKHPDEDIGFEKYGYVVCKECAEKVKQQNYEEPVK